MMEKVREEVEEIIPVFRACTQCRADAYGIPGKKSEDHHLGMTPSKSLLIFLFFNLKMGHELTNF